MISFLGGGYILSKKALKKFKKIVTENPKKYFYPEGQAEDLHMGMTLANAAIFVDCRDDEFRNRFFPVAVIPFRRTVPAWYTNISYYNASTNGLDCCSDVPAGFHYVKNATMYKYDYLTYHFHPFGLEKVERMNLPRKLSLKEIIAASDAKSFAIRYVNHTDYHNMTSSEYF